MIHDLYEAMTLVDDIRALLDAGHNDTANKLLKELATDLFICYMAALNS